LHGRWATPPSLIKKNHVKKPGNGASLAKTSQTIIFWKYSGVTMPPATAVS
jgi:hypothetical protein